MIHLCSPPLVVITTLFVMWALALNLNDILVPHLKKACDLTDLQSALIQTCYFGAYFLAALPAGWLMRKVGYKSGIILGLCICAAGAFMFYPSSLSREFSSFLVSLFVMASGAAILEVAANAYVVQLGSADTAEQRLNLVQTFNALGAAIAPIVGKMFILSGIEHSDAQLGAMSEQELLDYRRMEAGLVQGPYVVIGVLFLLIAVLVARSKLPAVDEQSSAAPLGLLDSMRRLWQHRHFSNGVAAQFAYVGAQVGVSSFLIRFVQVATDGSATEKTGAQYLFYHLALFLVGRAVGTVLMGKCSARTLLLQFSCIATLLAVVCTFSHGLSAIAAVVTIGFFNSIMFPTIFSLSLRSIDDASLAKPAASLLVMSIVGGAVVPAAMGLVSDQYTISRAFWVVAGCYAIVIGFAWNTPVSAATQCATVVGTEGAAVRLP